MAEDHDHDHDHDDQQRVLAVKDEGVHRASEHEGPFSLHVVSIGSVGAAALAGTSFPIDRHMTAAALGFDRPTANSLDSVSDRDFVLETLSAASITAVHLSRLAEELVIWSTPQFGFIRLSDAFSTGSSIMPQKRNPDAAELVRADDRRALGVRQPRARGREIDAVALPDDVAIADVRHVDDRAAVDGQFVANGCPVIVRGHEGAVQVEEHGPRFSDQFSETFRFSGLLQGEASLRRWAIPVRAILSRRSRFHKRAVIISRL